MKKVIISAVLVCLLSLPLAYIGCSNPSGGGRGGSGEVVGKGINAESVTFKLETVGGARYARSSLAIGEAYTLTIIKPRSQNEAGAVKYFDSNLINATVAGEPTVVNGRQRFAFSRQGGGTFYITFDQNGDIYRVEGLDDDGLLNPIGDNSNSIDGAYVTFFPITAGTQEIHGYEPIFFVMNSGYLTFFSLNTDLIDGKLIHSPAEYKIPVTVTSTEFQYSGEQEVRHLYEPPAGVPWVKDEWFGPFMYQNREPNVRTCDFKTLEYSLNGNTLTLTIRETWGEDKSLINYGFIASRVPTN